jgi:AraC family transcriptional regulator
VQLQSTSDQGRPAPAMSIGAHAAPCRRPAPLQKWRLKRVLDYVEGHLGDPIKLRDLAAAAGFTRMHFAAQFRAAVGMRPHHYVLRRRVERSRELLRDPSLTLVEIALSVGFRTQAHFTTVFRRQVGTTPHRWRRCSEQGGPTSPNRPATWFSDLAALRRGSG